MSKPKLIEKVAILSFLRCWHCEKRIKKGESYFAPEGKTNPKYCLECAKLSKESLGEW